MLLAYYCTFGVNKDKNNSNNNRPNLITSTSRHVIIITNRHRVTDFANSPNQLCAIQITDLTSSNYQY